jgi:hypothetical protein
VCHQVLKSLEFGLIVGGQPVAGGVVFEPPPPEPGLGEAPEQRAQQRVPILAEPDQRPRIQGSRVGERNRADPRVPGQRDLGGQQREAPKLKPDASMEY